MWKNAPEKRELALNFQNCLFTVIIIVIVYIAPQMDPLTRKWEKEERK